MENGTRIPQNQDTELCQSAQIKPVFVTELNTTQHFKVKKRVTQPKKYCYRHYWEVRQYLHLFKSKF